MRFALLLIALFAIGATSVYAAGQSLEDTAREAVVEYNDGNYYSAVILFRDCIEIARGIGDYESLAEAHYMAGNCEYVLTRYERAENHYKGALSALANLSEDELQLRGSVYQKLGALYYASGRFEKAVEVLENSWEYAQDTGDEESAHDTLRYIAMSHRQLGNWDQAEEWLERDEELVQEIGGYTREVYLGYNYLERGHLYAAQNRYDDALQVLADAISWFEDSAGDPVAEAKGHIETGKIFIEMSEFAKAIDALDKAAAIGREHEIALPQRAEAFYQIGRAYYSQDSVSDARNMLTESIALFAELGDDEGEAKASELLARLD